MNSREKASKPLALVGLLPFYMALYDQRSPDRRKTVESFRDTIAAELRNRNLEVVAAPICRLRSEFEAAVESFEAQAVDAVVTLHLAYSPSLESIDVLCRTELPLIVLDTTPDHDFGPGQHPDAIMRNHGIHGVQDLCNLLRRRARPFQIEAGHWRESDVFDRVVGHIQAAVLARAMGAARVGRLGDSFAGMGDFRVEPEVLAQRIGMQVVSLDPAEVAECLPSENDPAVEAEMAEDERVFDTSAISRQAHVDTTRAALLMRRLTERERLSAFCFNFLVFEPSAGIPTVPFFEGCKAMARGLGYAGEGDVLTAALVGALASVFPDTTFTEPFCPNWSDGTVFLSHMGEVNHRLLVGRPRLIEKPFAWTDVPDPVTAVGRLMPGRGLLVNLAPGAEGEFSLIVAPGEMLGIDTEDRMADTVHGWFAPGPSLPDFLKRYSMAGGTHHCAFVYEAPVSTMTAFAQLMGWQAVVLE